MIELGNNVSTLTATLNERVEVYQAASLRCAALEEENSTLSRELQTSQVSLEDAQSKMERAQQELSKVRHELEQQKPVLETTRKAVRDRMGYQEKMMLAKFESTKKHVEKLERELEQVKKERANIIKDKGDVVTSLLIEKEKLETDLKRSKHMSDELMDRCEALEKVAKKPWYKRMGKEESNLLNTTTESLFG
ncbi:hypothetical protein SARC_10352 [Sphaeroforma arctica JP610]|uniref:Uncharacterized protein n=1 Tax=Sphaeroforma arctica JP610 TaxID=667725 RepID=A0A0L0FK99_9EUKA|nr:hypothetical protein SARC_10352 [Sphaeroforma arctica JP610]KNC77180.1 hypothetical protein SARC_10352 [Sphaeroforma arctica JP610]|eukprot:XP_014151082.1 hypothetical protein SARC_10352 [Sphaeroforma arctica JP610]